MTALHDFVGMLTRCLGHASGVSFWMFRAFGLGASAEYATFMGFRKPLLVLFGLTEQERWVNDPVGTGRAKSATEQQQGGPSMDIDTVLSREDPAKPFRWLSVFFALDSRPDAVAFSE